MDVHYFLDILFDLLNESDELDLADLRTNVNGNGLIAVARDGTVFDVSVRSEHQ